MKHEEMIVACCTRHCRQGARQGVSGRRSSTSGTKRGIGWTPTNVQITCFDVIAESPFGSLGDLVLIPDEAARVRVDFGEASRWSISPLGNIRHTDGRPWEICTRSMLKAALERLRQSHRPHRSGRLRAGVPVPRPPGPLGDAYSMAGFRAERRFAETTDRGDARGRHRAGHLHEGISAPANMRSPWDRSAAWPSPTMSRSCANWCGAVAERLGREVTFTPIRDPAGVGNGVHIHLSFLDRRQARDI